jgi:heavy metal sensor kinase
VRLVSRVHALDGRSLLIRLAHSEEPLYSRLRELLLASLVVLPAILAIAGFAGYALARRALRPMEEMARRAREISPDNLQARLPNDDRDDELGSLARVFNQTLDRLQQAFEQLRRFTSDASHELRTPLAMIRSVGEVGLQKDGTRTDYRDAIGSMLEEVNRLTSLVDNLLTMSRADSGHIQLRRQEFPLMTLARESAGLLEVLAEEKSLRIEIGGDECARVAADPLVLRQALVNVMHNAIKFSPPAASIQVRVMSAKDSVTVEVEDRGPGIPAEDRHRVFDRFYRVDMARSSAVGGVGLGLSIAKWAVNAHEGTIAVGEKLGPGCLFRITLPAVALPR